ncbi:MAG: hypothetical protein ACE5LV_03365 [Candidatus Aminicenantales bacterium]
MTRFFELRILRGWVLGCIVLLLSVPFACQKAEKGPAGREAITPPVAKKIPKELTIHGHTRIDNYYWLNERDNPEVLEYLKAENAYKEAMMAHTKDLQDKLNDEIIGRIKKTDISVPYRDNGYYYYVRYEEGGEYPIYCRKKGSLEAEEEILLNVNEMAKGYDFYSVTGLSVSPDNTMLSYGVDTVSRRKYTIHFKNLKTGEEFDAQIPNTTGEGFEDTYLLTTTGPSSTPSRTRRLSGPTA